MLTYCEINHFFPRYFTTSQTKRLLFLLSGEVKLFLLPSPQTDPSVCPTPCGSFRPPSRVSGSCRSSCSSSAGRRIPSPRGGEAGSQTPVAGKHTDRRTNRGSDVAEQQDGQEKKKGKSPSHDQPPTDHLSKHLHFHLFMSAWYQRLLLSLKTFLQWQHPADNNGAPN